MNDVDRMMKWSRRVRPVSPPEGLGDGSAVDGSWFTAACTLDITCIKVCQRVAASILDITCIKVCQRVAASAYSSA